MNHVNIRFAQLECILNKYPDVKCIIGGGTVDDNYMYNKNGTLKPTLGRGLALDQWDNQDECKAVADAIEQKWNDFMKKYNTKENERLFIGVVGFDDKLDKQIKKSREEEEKTFGISDLNPSNTLIHVWGANITNFDKSNVGGDGQADAMQHTNGTTNSAGAFGIITTPTNGGNEKTINKSNEELLKKHFTKSKSGGKTRSNKKCKKSKSYKCR